MIYMKHVHIATVVDGGSNDGSSDLGVFADIEKARAVVHQFNPHDDDEGSPKWTLRSSFDHEPVHTSGATRVEHYSLEGSRWWRAHIITFEVR